MKSERWLLVIFFLFFFSLSIVTKTGNKFVCKLLLLERAEGSFRWNPLEKESVSDFPERYFLANQSKVFLFLIQLDTTHAP